MPFKWHVLILSYNVFHMVNSQRNGVVFLEEITNSIIGLRGRQVARMKIIFDGKRGRSVSSFDVFQRKIVIGSFESDVRI